MAGGDAGGKHEAAVIARTTRGSVKSRECDKLPYESHSLKLRGTDNKSYVGP